MLDLIQELEVRIRLPPAVSLQTFGSWQASSASDGGGRCVNEEARRPILGHRSGETAIEFVCDLSKRLAMRVQVTSDGHRAYLEAIEAGFGAAVDYAQLIKMFGEVPHPASPQARKP